MPLVKHHMAKLAPHDHTDYKDKNAVIFPSFPSLFVREETFKNRTNTFEEQ